MNVRVEPDDGRDSAYRRRIVKTRRMQGTRTGHWVTLECGHVAITFGDLKLLGDGGAICVECRSKAGKA